MRRSRWEAVNFTRLPAKLDVPPFTSITGKMNVRPAVAASVLPTVAEEVHFKAPIKAATTLLRSYASVRGWQPTPQQIGANVAASGQTSQAAETSYSSSGSTTGSSTWRWSLIFDYPKAALH